MKGERADANCVQTKIAKQKFRARGFGILVPRKNRYADRFFRRDFAEWHTRDLSSHVKGLYDQAVADVSEVDVRGGTAAPTYGLGNRAADFWFAKCAVSFGHRTMCSGGALASKPLQNSKAPNGMERGQNHKKETPTESGPPVIAGNWF